MQQSDWEWIGALTPSSVTMCFTQGDPSIPATENSYIVTVVVVRFMLLALLHSLRAGELLMGGWVMSLREVLCYSQGYIPSSTRIMSLTKISERSSSCDSI